MLQTNSDLTQKDKQASWFSYDNAQNAINTATIIFAAIKIYERYQTIGTAQEFNPHDYQVMQAIKNIIASLCPEMLKSIGIYGFFLIDSTAIVFKALVYKSIAKLLLVCAQGDISDLMGSIMHGGTQMIKLFL